MKNEICKQNDDIPTSQIERDITDTQKEIDQMRKQIDILSGDIFRRKEFISDLESILEYRKI